jgi:4-carboxymuconolactone decarboxylase
LIDTEGTLHGPFAGFLLSPSVGEALQELGVTIRFAGTLTPRMREIATIAVASRLKCSYMLRAHTALATSAGLSADEVAAITRMDGTLLSDRAEAECLSFTCALLDGDVGDDLWHRVLPVLEKSHIFELVVVVGYYSLLALQLRVFRVN